MSFIVSSNQNKESSIFMDLDMFSLSTTSTIRTIWPDATYPTAAIDYGKDCQTYVFHQIDDCTIHDNNSNSKNINEKKKK